MYHNIRSAYCDGKLATNSSLPAFIAAHEDFDKWYNSTAFINANKTPYNKMYHTFGSAGDQTIFCKYYLQKQLTEKLYDRIKRSSRAQRSHERICRLQALGVNTPDSLGYLRSKTRSYLFLQIIDGFNDLRHYQEAPDSHAELPLHTLIDRALEQLICLHDGGYCHGDFKWPNILLNESSGELMLIDFDGVRYQLNRKLPRSYVKDVARFLVSCNEGGLGKEHIAYVLQRYAQMRDLRVAAVERAVKPRYAEITEKHARKRLR